MNYSKEMLEDAVKNSLSFSSVARFLGLQDKGRNVMSLKSKITSYGIDTSHFKGRYCYGKKKPLEEILVENSNYQSSKLRERLFEEGIKTRKCEQCGHEMWNGYPIPLQLHHKNGKHDDNRIENLVILCSNCHDIIHHYIQTKTKRYNLDKVGISEVEKDNK